MYYYANINSADICVSVIENVNELEENNLIEIESYDTDYILRKYDKIQKTFGDKENIKMPINECTLNDRITKIEGILSRNNLE